MISKSKQFKMDGLEPLLLIPLLSVFIGEFNGVNFDVFFGSDRLLLLNLIFTLFKLS